MLAGIRLLGAPYAAAVWISSSLPVQVQTAVNVVALALLFAGVLVVARFKASGEASDRAGLAADRERLAEAQRADRAEKELTAAMTRIAVLEGQPLEQMAAMMSEMTKVLQQIHTAVVPPRSEY